MANSERKNDGKDVDRLRDQLRIWRHNRKLYPGWLLAPYQTRHKIWSNTRFWIDTSINVQTIWSPAQLLVLWRELMWRVELCLQVLPHGAFQILSQLANSSELHDLWKDSVGYKPQTVFEDSEWLGELTPSVSELRRDWIECMMSYLFASRIRPDMDGFEQIQGTLSQYVDLTQDQLCNILYQRSLKAFSELNRDLVSRLLDQWPVQPEDPYWMVRKASLLLELGDRDGARLVASDALKQIRQQPRGNELHYWALSREGWCLHFLYQIHESHRLSTSRRSTSMGAKIGERRDQLDYELEIARCSPSTELRMLEERIAQGRPPPIRGTYTFDTAPNFDDGLAGEMHHLGSDDHFESLGPAINVLMACDVTALSPKIQNVVFFSTAVSSALQWLRDEHPGLWTAFALRYRGIGIESDIEPASNRKLDAIRRAILDRLSTRDLQWLFTSTMRELDRLASSVESTGQLGLGSSRHLDLWFMRRLADVTARLSMCMEEEERNSALSMTLRLVKIEYFRKHPSFRETVQNMLGRVVPFLTLEQLNSWLPNLLIDFPMVAKDDDTFHRWPLITMYINLPKATALSRPTSKDFDSGIRSLISAVSDVGMRQRTDAALRLAFLNRCGLLSDSESLEFERVLLKRVDSHGLPLVDDNYVFKAIHLEWPTAIRERVIMGLTSWIVSEEVKDRFATKNEESAATRDSLSSVDPDDYLHNIRMIAQDVQKRREEFSIIFGNRVRSHILQSLLAWWNRERELYSGRPDSRSVFEVDPYDRVDLALQVVFSCVLDSRSGDFGESHELLMFLNEIGALREVVPYSYPIFASLNPGAQEKYWDRLLLALWHSERRIAIKALIACYEWQRVAERRQMMTMPQDVAVAIIAPIAGLHGEFSYCAYAIVIRLLEENCLGAGSSVMKRLTDAVESAAAKLEYAQQSNMSLQGSGSEVEMHAHFRRRLAGLIYTMRDMGISIGPVSSSWFNRARNDHFVDVRQAALVGKW